VPLVRETRRRSGRCCNLIFNAVECMLEGLDITVRARAENHDVLLEVADTRHQA